MSDQNTSTFTLHPGQNLAWKAIKDSNIRTVGLFSGIQGGKTIFGTMALRWMLKHDTRPKTNWIVGAPTYKILRQSTLPTFKKLFTNYLGEYNGKDECFVMHDGRAVWFRTSTDSDSVEGLPDCAGAIIDEAGKCSYRFWVNIQARIGRLLGKAVLCSTWYALNWMYHDLWVPFKNGELTDAFIVSFSSAMNPTFPPEEIERQRKLLSPAEFSRKFLGEPSKPEGLVFPEFGDLNRCEPKDFDFKKVEVYAGVDWGFDHPMAIDIGAYPGDGNCYTISLFKKSGMSVNQQIELLKAKAQMFNIRAFYCGHDRPDMIAEMQKAGLTAMKYFEGRSDYREVNAGNQKLGEMIRTRRYQVFRGIEYERDLEDEFFTYMWDHNEGERKEREKPISINDDLIAASRYRIVGTMHLLEQKIIESKAPGWVARPWIDEFDPSETPEDWRSS